MTIKLSHSGANTYTLCGEKYRLHYSERLRPITMSSPLLYGGAIDLALNILLENKSNPKALEMALIEFDKNWEQGENFKREKVDLPLNPNIKYLKKDYDGDLLEKQEWAELFKYEPQYFEMRSRVEEQLKTVDWLDIPEKDRMHYNYGNWLCLSRKGKMLIEAYHNDLLRHFKKIICVQKKLSLLDDAGNDLNGLLDFVAELQDGRVAIVDNKTSSGLYEEDSVRKSPQLAMYKQILDIQGFDPKIDCCAYAVMNKVLIKDITKTCKTCNYIGTGSHKTCDNIIEGKRCGGNWNKVKKFTVETQFVVDNVSDEFGQKVIENAVTVKSCIEMGLFPKNFDACNNMYGSKCPYYLKCHGNSDKGLIKLEEKK